MGDCQNWDKIYTPFIWNLFRTRLAQGASKIGLDKLWSKSMHLPWNQYHVGPVNLSMVAMAAIASTLIAVGNNDGNSGVGGSSE